MTTTKSDKIFFDEMKLSVSDENDSAHTHDSLTSTQYY